MSIKELREGVRLAPRAEKLRLLAMLKHDLRTGTPARQEALERAHEEIDAGEFVTLTRTRRRARPRVRKS
jgi:hypothetical protein